MSLVPSYDNQTANDADPVLCAIDGVDGVNNMFACAGNPIRREVGLTEAFMAQRCAQNWDGYCDMYARQELNADFNRAKFIAFITKTLASMFCQNDVSVPGNQCAMRCEQYNPTSNSSVQVCMEQGELIFRDSYKPQAIDTAFPQTGRLNLTEPLRMGKCPKVCNLITAEKLTNANVPLNIALDEGIAMDLLENLAKNIVAQGKQSLVTNDRLNKFMNAYVQNGSVKPGYASLGNSNLVTSQKINVPAVNPSIPRNVALNVDDQGNQLGPRQLVTTPAPAATEGFRQVCGSEGCHEGFKQVCGSEGCHEAYTENCEGYEGCPYDKKEYFELAKEPEKPKNNTLMVVLVIALVALGFVFLSKNMNKRKSTAGLSL